jgi:hypothetical protein
MGKTMNAFVSLLGIVLVPLSALAGPDAGPPAALGSARIASPEALIASGREAVRKMGTYRARLVKTERIKGEVLPAQTIDILVRPSPRAVRMEFVAGAKSGRRVLWRENNRPNEILVREGGILGITSLWLDTSKGLPARAGTNHAVSEIGFAYLFDIMERDLAKGKSQGSYGWKDLGLDANGLYRIEWIAPQGARGLYAQRTRLGIDPKLHVPVDIEVFDAQGLLERYQYRNVHVQQVPKPSDFEDL